MKVIACCCSSGPRFASQELRPQEPTSWRARSGLRHYTYIYTRARARKKKVRAFQSQELRPQGPTRRRAATRLRPARARTRARARARGVAWRGVAWRGVAWRGARALLKTIPDSRVRKNETLNFLIFGQSLSRHLPLKQGSESRQTLPKRVSDDSRQLNF